MLDIAVSINIFFERELGQKRTRKTHFIFSIFVECFMSWHMCAHIMPMCAYHANFVRTCRQDLCLLFDSHLFNFSAHKCNYLIAQMAHLKKQPNSLISLFRPTFRTQTIIIRNTINFTRVFESLLWGKNGFNKRVFGNRCCSISELLTLLRANKLKYISLNCIYLHPKIKLLNIMKRINDILCLS